MENIKSDALFSYQPPFNLLAFIVLRPLSWVVTPRSLHRVNVALIRITSFPVLVAIAVFERHFRRRQGTFSTISLPGEEATQHRKPSVFDALTNSTTISLLEAMFEADTNSDDDISLFTEDRPHRDERHNFLQPLESQYASTPKKRDFDESTSHTSTLEAAKQKESQRNRTTYPHGADQDPVEVLNEVKKRITLVEDMITEMFTKGVDVRVPKRSSWFVSTRPELCLKGDFLDFYLYWGPFGRLNNIFLCIEYAGFWKNLHWYIYIRIILGHNGIVVTR